MDRAPQADTASHTLTLTGLALRQALDAISLDVPENAFVGLLGSAGSGKSALLAVLAGTAKPSAGTAALHGKTLLGIAAHRRGLGVVQQNDALFPNLSLAENIGYPLRLRGVPSRARAQLTDAAAELVQLDNPARLPCHATPAERQRAAWARATIFGPRLLLLDEPLSEQGAEQRAAMLAILRRLHAMLGATTLMATRVAADALALSDQVAVLDGGRIAQIATPATLYDRPISAAVARAGGEANLLPGTVQAIDEDRIARVRLECGPTVDAAAPETIKPRDPCLLFVRPERIAVANMRATDMGEGAMDATVLESLHLGDSLRLRLLLGSGAELLVKRPLAAGARPFKPGDPVAIAWQPEHAAVFGGR
jgi:putative spermidine/putrescine transport system ATP-binding protein